MKKLFPAVLISLVLVLGAAAQDRYALVVGVDSYDLLSSLKAGVNDAERIAAYYKGLGFKVWLIDDRQESRMYKPSLANVDRVMANVEETAQGQAIRELVFFFAGHGVQIEGRNWLCFPETQLTSNAGMLGVDLVLLPWLRRIGADLTMVYLDACRNDLGAIRAAGVERGVEVVGLPREEGAIESSRRDLAVFYAAKPGSFSFERPDGTSGFFTDTLLEALQSDSTRTVADLYAYLRKELPERTEKAFGRPQIPNLGGDLDIGATFTKGKVDLSFADARGRIFIESEPSDAEVFVNGAERGRTPILLEGIDPGIAKVEVSKGFDYAARQVTVESRGFVKLSLRLERQFGDAVVRSVRTQAGAADPIGEVGDLVSFLKSMKASIDGAAAFPIAGLHLPNLEPGERLVRLFDERWLWEGRIAIRPREAVGLDPLFVPAGTLELASPADLRISFVNRADGSRRECQGGDRTMDGFPAGTWDAEFSGERYLEGRARFVLEQGRLSRLRLEPKLKPPFERGQRVHALEMELRNKETALAAEIRSRSNFDFLGKLGLGTGLASLASGLVVGIVSFSSYRQYLEASTPETAARRHEVTLTLFNVSLGLACGGLGLTATVAPIGFLGGKRPEKTRSEIERLLGEVDALKAQGVAY